MSITINGTTGITNASGGTVLDTVSIAPVGLNATGSAPIYACRARANFDGRSISVGASAPIRSSGNISSIVFVSVGTFTVNFTTPMPNADYVVIGTGASNSGPQPVVISALLNSSSGPYSNKTVSSVTITISDTDNSTNVSAWEANIIVFG
jgi:hypothetical protein